MGRMRSWRGSGTELRGSIGGTLAAVSVPPALLAAIEQAREDERLRLGRLMARLRVAATGTFLPLTAYLGYVADMADWRPYVPMLTLYATLGGALLLTPRRWQSKLFGWAAFVDAGLIWAMQDLALPVSPHPAGVAGFTLGLFALLMALNGAVLRGRVLWPVALATMVAQGALMRAASVGWPAVATAVVVLGVLTLAVQASAGRLERLALALAETQVTREQNKKLLELQRDKDTLTHLIVHDLRAPLTGLMGRLDLARLMATRAGQGELVHDLELGLGTAGRLSGMITDLLNIGKLEEGGLALDLGPLDLGGLLREIADEQRVTAQQGEVTLTVKAEPTVWARVDRSLLRRVLENLVSNALRFAPKPGRVELELLRSEESIELWVHNDGPPVAEPDRLTIFDKFVQGAQEGSRRRGFGLGLHFCKLAVEAHGGAIRVEDRAGHPCSFVVRLPVALVVQAGERGTRVG